MSVVTTLTTAQTIVAKKRRTFRVAIESQSGSTPFIQGWREELDVDAAGSTIGKPRQELLPIVMLFSQEAVAALPAQFQQLPGQVSAFFDWMEAQVQIVEPTPTPEPTAIPLATPDPALPTYIAPPPPE